MKVRTRLEQLRLDHALAEAVYKRRRSAASAAAVGRLRAELEAEEKRALKERLEGRNAG